MSRWVPQPEADGFDSALLFQLATTLGKVFIRLVDANEHKFAQIRGTLAPTNTDNVLRFQRILIVEGLFNPQTLAL